MKEMTHNVKFTLEQAVRPRQGVE